MNETTGTESGPDGASGVQGMAENDTTGVDAALSGTGGSPNDDLSVGGRADA